MNLYKNIDKSVKRMFIKLASNSYTHKIFALLLILNYYHLVSAQTISKNYHYSCSLCYTSKYTDCISCKKSQVLVTLNQNNPAKNNQLSMKRIPTGLCIGQVKQKEWNIFGVIIVALCAVFILASWIKLWDLYKLELLFFNILFLQSLGLFAFVDIAWHVPVNYILEGLSYLMVTTTISGNFKQSSDFFPTYGGYKQSAYLKNTDFLKSFAITSCINAFCFLIILVVNLLERCCVVRAQPNNEQPNSCLEKIKLTCKVIILFVVQQTFLVIYFCLGFGDRSAGFVAASLIYLILMVFVLNTFTEHLSLFKSKTAQNLMILNKTFAPIFILSISHQYMIFVFLSAYLIIDLIRDCCQSKNRNKFLLILPRVMTLITIGCLTLTFGFELKSNSENVSYGFNLVSASFLVFTILFLILQKILLVKSLIKSWCYGKQSVHGHEEQHKNQSKIQLGKIESKSTILNNNQLQMASVDKKTIKLDSP